MSFWSKEVFAKNLKRYMDEAMVNQKELSDIVGVSASTLNEWLSAKKYPRIDKIERLATYFGILKSDLIEDKSPVHRKMYTPIEIGLLIKEKRLLKKMTRSQLGEAVGISASTVTKWESGNTPKLKSATMKQLAAVLDISPLNLIGFTVEHTETEARKTRLKDEWNKMFSEANFTDEEFFEIANFAQFVINKRNNKK